MVVRAPGYLDRFHCLAGACPHTCCAKWEVVIDEPHGALYRAAEGALGEKLRRHLRRDEEGDLCFALTEGRCPFLDGAGLCQIHRVLGEAATSVTCQEHPRFTEDYGPFREITLSASCPEANRLLLESGEPLAFAEWETAEAAEAAEAAEPGDPWLETLVPLRGRMMEALADRRLPLRRRLGQFLRMAEAAQALLDADAAEALGEVTRGEAPEAWLAENALAALGELEVLEEDWPAVLEAAKRGEETLRPEEPLERIAGYFAFRYLLKCVNDGDILSRAQFCVLAVLAVARIGGVCGLAESLRRFSCEIEHSEENLETLQETLWRESLVVLMETGKEDCTKGKNA